MSTYPICQGCQGKGWVDSQYYGPMICPLCKGTGQATITYEVERTDDRVPCLLQKNIGGETYNAFGGWVHRDFIEDWRENLKTFAPSLTLMLEEES